MQMTGFVLRDAIIPNLRATTKEAVIREMVQSLRESARLQPEDAEEITKAILKRELLGSTGIGQGVAIPHAKHRSVEKLMGTVAIAHGGVAFDAQDGEPVYVFVLLVSPPDKPGDHLRALEITSRSLHDENFVRSLRSAETKDKIWELLTAASTR
jgi:PTS system fructose-specific IIA component/PTS system nitrogen regulatory IIA component